MRNSSIMVVEDEVIVAEDLRVRLSAMGYTVPETVGSSEEAISRVSVLCPDLILMDIVLEGSAMDGIETARTILSQRDVPIIFVTAFADDATLERAKTAGPFAYILKPFNERELYSAIELALHKHRTDMEIKKRDAILFATCFAIEWFLRHKKESRKAKSNHPRTIESGIVEILGQVGLAIDASAIMVFKKTPGLNETSGTDIQYIWEFPGTPRVLPFSSAGNPAFSIPPTIWQDLLATGNSYAGSTMMLPEAERGFFETCNIASMAMLPLFNDNTLWGFIAIFSSIPRVWSDGEMEAMRVAGNIVGAVVE
ncbi:MAG: response regulator [Methanoregula sp.]|nr:response regulator [Methanoregula sp.]